ncbi:hypothetical protein LJR030_001438 [Rhizobium sp. LjRoot30]|uniref:thermonuclease family protein n=1 Tax=Rhizobium sp. LjRoot30 TaxID=3342320 RepID=UPI003ECEB59B
MAKAKGGVRRKTTNRRSKAPRTPKRTWPWLALTVLTAGGLYAYEHRTDWLPQTPSQIVAFKKQAEQRNETSPEKTASISRKTVAEERVAQPIRSATKTRTDVAAIPIPQERKLDQSLVGEGYKAHFAYCGTTGLKNCVVDGATFWHRGMKIRLAGIDAPGMHKAGCDDERRRGFAAAVKLKEFLNAGPFNLTSAGVADGSQGGKVRVVTRGGKSLADELLSLGLVRQKSGGQAKPWC